MGQEGGLVSRPKMGCKSAQKLKHSLQLLTLIKQCCWLWYDPTLPRIILIPRRIKLFDVHRSTPTWWELHRHCKWGRGSSGSGVWFFSSCVDFVERTLMCRWFGFVVRDLFIDWLYNMFRSYKGRRYGRGVGGICSVLYCTYIYGFVNCSNIPFTTGFRVDLLNRYLIPSKLEMLDV